MLELKVSEVRTVNGYEKQILCARKVKLGASNIQMTELRKLGNNFFCLLKMNYKLYKYRRRTWLCLSEFFFRFERESSGSNLTIVTKFYLAFFLRRILKGLSQKLTFKHNQILQIDFWDTNFHSHRCNIWIRTQGTNKVICKHISGEVKWVSN